MDPRQLTARRRRLRSRKAYGSRANSTRKPGCLSEKSRVKDMKISDAQIQVILRSSATATVDPLSEIGTHNDDALVNQVTQSVMAMPDREEMIESLRAQIANGTYAPTGSEIAEAMIRRAIADRIR